MKCGYFNFRFSFLPLLFLTVALHANSSAQDSLSDLDEALGDQLNPKVNLEKDLNRSKEYDVLPVGGAIQRNSNREATNKDMDGLFEKMAEMLGIPETSRLYRPFKRHFEQTAPKKKAKNEKNQAKQEEEMTQAWSTDASLLPFQQDLPIFLHYRGRFGIDLPAIDQVWNPASLMSKEEFKSKLEDFIPQLKKLAEKETEAPEIPNCIESKTEKDRLTKNKVTKEQKNDQILDLLFINKKDVPFDYEEAFGRRVVLREYQAGKVDGLSYYIKKLGVTCLPYRIRATAEYRFQDWGMNALKNYDEDPDGKGKVSPLIENKAMAMGYSWKK